MRAIYSLVIASRSRELFCGCQLDPRHSSGFNFHPHSPASAISIFTQSYLKFVSILFWWIADCPGCT